jgi:hypothetical protein
MYFKMVTFSDAVQQCKSATPMAQYKNSVSILLSFCSERHNITAVGANLCVRRPLELNGKGIRGVGGAADKEALSVHAINIIS